MNTLSIDNFTAFIGIDWADTKHDICIHPTNGQQREFDYVIHRPERIDQWAHEMHQRFGGPIAVILELTKGPIVSALQKVQFSLFCFQLTPQCWQNIDKPSNPLELKMILRMQS